MAIVVSNQGSITMSAAEQTLGAARTDGKTYVIQLDFINMAAGDFVEVYCYVKTAGSGGTARVYFEQSFADEQTGSPVYQSIPVSAPYSVEFKIKQPVGTFRSVDYALFSID